MARNAIESDFWSSKNLKKKVTYPSEMVRNVIEWHNGQSVNHSGIYTVFALGQIHKF